jgi:hypothetical protein
VRPPSSVVEIVPPRQSQQVRAPRRPWRSSQNASDRGSGPLSTGAVVEPAAWEGGEELQPESAHARAAKGTRAGRPFVRIDLRTETDG